MDPAPNTLPHYHHKFALDDTFYGMDEEDSRFLKERTGIQDDAALKEYVMSVAREAYVVCKSPLAALTDVEPFRSHDADSQWACARSIPLHTKVQLHEVCGI